MSSVSEIRHHIRVIQETCKITKAMYLISSAKMQRANRMHAQNQVFFNRVRADIRFILEHSNVDITQNPYYRQHNQPAAAYVVIAGDKGLCGGYNSDVLKTCDAAIEKNGKRPVIYTIGHVASDYYRRKGMQPDTRFDYVIHDPILRNAREIVAELRRVYSQERLVSEVYLVYTFMSKTGQQPHMLRLLPILKEDFATAPLLHQEESYAEELTYHPDAQTVLQSMVQHYLVGLVYAALAEAYASENRARMTAMDSAVKNGEEMLSRLSLELNHARQAQITMEINEIVSGGMQR